MLNAAAASGSAAGQSGQSISKNIKCEIILVIFELD